MSGGKLKLNLQFLQVLDPEKNVLVPFYSQGISATFSGLFSDVAIEWIDLSVELIKRPSSTFFCRVDGDSMKDERLQHGDIVVVDKSLPYIDGKKVVIWLHAEQCFTVKRLSVKSDSIMYLIPANENLKPYLLTEHDIFFGVVTWILHKEV
jgi:DNA polymerase V